MTRWIENVSWDDCKHGRHYDAGPNAMLIQIADPATFFPDPHFNFKEAHRFEFLDAEDADGFDEDFKISDEQAAEIVALLQRALDKSMNVVVHCHAGICRSGAVVEVASMMGFTPTDRLRIPNLRVKHKMMKVLGWTYDENEKSEPVNGVVSSGGIVVPANGDW
jgi:rhodanese-related sulfurtransferase